MERPDLLSTNIKVVGYIHFLEDELERLKADKKPFPSLKEFTKWFTAESVYPEKPVEQELYEYFSQFQYEKTVFPKVGDIVEGTSFGELMIRGELDGFRIANAGDTFNVREIRPVTRPTREEVVAKVESKLDNDELTFDRELVEQFLKILRGDK